MWPIVVLLIVLPGVVLPIVCGLNSAGLIPLTRHYRLRIAERETEASLARARAESIKTRLRLAEQTALDNALAPAALPPATEDTGGDS